MDPRLLEILRCPVTHLPLRPLSAPEQQRLREAIAAGGVENAGGRPVTGAPTDALVTRDGARIYPLDDGIPVLLADEAILAGDLLASDRPGPL